jgi:MoxR-like ATPase
MSADFSGLTVSIATANQTYNKVQAEMAKVIVGQKELINRLLIALLANGHILLEGLPGLAKTLTVLTLAKIIQCDFKRIQFTPDLLPADLIGTNIYNPKDGTFSVNKGPIFTNILLTDEINRAPAKVQSALLEVMQERQVTIGGETFKVGAPFLVLATQNPIEQEGTYALPEAQTDRFMMKVLVDYPTFEEEKEIIARMATLSTIPEITPQINTDTLLRDRQLVNSIYVDDKIVTYILNIVFATRFPAKYGIPIEDMLLSGASPRASIALQLSAKAHAFLNGRAYVIPHDIKQVIYDVLRHRIRRTYEAEAEEISTDHLIKQILDHLPVP